MFSAVMELDLLMLDERVTAPEVGGWRARLQFNAGRLASDDENPIYISSMVEPWPSQVYRDVNELWVSATEHDKLVYGLALQSGGRTHAYREVSEVFLSLRDGRWVQGSFQLGPVHPRPREMHIASDPYPGELSELARELEPDTDWVEFHCPLIVRCWRLQGDDTEYVEEADWSSNQCTTAAVELGLEGWLPESHPAYHDAYERSFHPW